MTAITVAANRKRKGIAKQRRYLMKASTTIVKGALVIGDANGLADNAADTAGVVVLGIAAETMVSAASGSYWIQVEYDAEWLFAATSITQAMVGLVAMVIVDNNTVDDAAGATNDIRVGLLTEFVSTTSGWVNIPGLSI